MSFELRKVVLISFTEAGDRLAYELEHQLREMESVMESGAGKKLSCCYECDRYCYETYNAYHGISFKSGRKVIENTFGECDYIIFIGACGMAVRMIDGLVRTKDKDPGIVVVDSKGKFAVSLLSGHLGGANELAGQIAEMIDAIPVITTATDVGGKFSPDMFAKKNHLYITDLNMAKQVAKTVLTGGRIFMKSDYEISNKNVYGIVLNGSDNVASLNQGCKSDMTKYDSQAENTKAKYDDHIDSVVYIGYDAGRLQDIKERYGNVLWLMPKDIIIGVGCKKNTEERKFEDEILRHLKENGIDIRRVREIHTIDIKKDEAAIKKFARKYNIVCRFYSADELKNVNGEFLHSKFVESVTGVDNVCERSALIGSEKLIVGKCAENGITFAAATYKKWRIIAE